MTAWRMAFRAGKGGTSKWPQCQEMGMAAIGYSPVNRIDLSRYSQEKFEELWRKLKLEITQKESLKRFVYEMQRDDMIYVKEGTSIIGKGVVIGDYKFFNDEQIEGSPGIYWRHRRRVSWMEAFPTVHVLAGRSQQYPVEELSDEDVRRIEDAAKKILGENNLGEMEEFLPLDLPDDEAWTDDPDYVPEEGDHREVIERQVKERRGQQQFRDALRQRYGDRCLVTGCQVLAALEAAHIKPYRGENDNDPANGLLLRADIHTLFDLDLIGIEPETLRVEVVPAVAKDKNYGSLDGKKLCLTGKRRPHRGALKERYQQFQQHFG